MFEVGIVLGIGLMLGIIVLIGFEVGRLNAVSPTEAAQGQLDEIEGALRQLLEHLLSVQNDFEAPEPPSIAQMIMPLILERVLPKWLGDTQPILTAAANMASDAPSKGEAQEAIRQEPLSQVSDGQDHSTSEGISER